MLSAEIIAIGSELLTPRFKDTNSLYLTEQLNSIGITVVTAVVAELRCVARGLGVARAVGFRTVIVVGRRLGALGAPFRRRRTMAIGPGRHL